jgi:predicted MFS family arabinose efflux permease
LLQVNLTVSRHYGIQYGTVAVMFLCSAAGYIVTAFLISISIEKLGRAKTLIIAEVLLLLGYFSIVLTPPFPAIAAS